MLKGKNVLSYLKTNQILGLSKPGDKLFDLDQNQLLYTSGHNLIKFDSVTKIQDIISCSENSKEISCLCVNEKKDQILIAESSETKCQLSIYHVEFLKLKKEIDVRKTLGFNQNSKKENLSIIRYIQFF